MRVIGVIGRSGAGKTTAAGIIAAALIDQGVAVKMDAFAVPIKAQLRRASGRSVRKDEDRAVMQHVGASVRGIDPDWYVKALARRNNMDAQRREAFADAWEPADVLVIGDVRYANEAGFCRRHGVLVLVEGSARPLAGAEALHETEAFAAGVSRLDVDHVICRQPSLAKFAEAARMVAAAFLDGEREEAEVLRNGD